MNIYLFRNSGPEDEITITPMMNYFKIVYYDSIARTSHFIYANESEVVAYVDDLFQLLENDIIDPFTMVQFTFPCFPSVLYKIVDLNTHIRLGIIDRLTSVLRNWPESIQMNTSNIVLPDLDYII